MVTPDQGPSRGDAGSGWLVGVYCCLSQHAFLTYLRGMSEKDWFTFLFLCVNYPYSLPIFLLIVDGLNFLEPYIC